MNSYLIHGKDSLGSRNRLTELLDSFKQKGYEVVRESAGESLFSEKTIYVFENPKSFPKELNNREVIIFYDGNAPLALLKTLPKNTKTEKFDLPKKLFAFLDRPKLNSFHELTKAEPVELIFFMLGRQFRDLYWAKTDPKTLKYPEWRITKLAGEASRYNNLPQIIAEFAKIDNKVKSGEIDLMTSLDLLIAKHLE